MNLKIMDIPNYAHANNVKYIVDDIPLHRWCQINGYSYPAAYQMLRRGLSIDQMRKRIFIKKINQVHYMQLQLNYQKFILMHQEKQDYASEKKSCHLRIYMMKECYQSI